MAPLLVYWGVRGFAQPIRVMFAHAGEDLEEKFYYLGPAPTFDRSEWTNVKPNLDVDFPNLPYYIEGDVKLSQSIAITRYVARKFGLDGKTEAEKQRIDVLEQELVDYRGAQVVMAYGPGFKGYAPGGFETAKETYLKELDGKYKALSQFLGNRKWFAGDNLSYVDFIAYEFLDIHRLLSKGSYDKYEPLVKFVERFESLPNVRKYLDSDKYMKWPVNNDQASFGSRLQPYPGK